LKKIKHIIQLLKLTLKPISLAVIFTFTASLVYAQSSFVIKKIKIEGLQRVTEGTVFNYLPISAGERLDPNDTQAIMTALYKTGFFTDIKLGREGQALVIKVKERSTIGSLKFKGNEDISSDKLRDALKELGLAEGRVFDSSILEKIKTSLKSEYYAHGKYNARIDVAVQDLPRNRVGISINISEGKTTKIAQIKIIGNHVFPEKELIEQFILSTPHLWSFFTHDDQYSKQKLDASLEALKSYYMDRGYIQFNILSTQVSLTPDRKGVYITVSIAEGAHYNFKGFAFSGQLFTYSDQLPALVDIKSGEEFSRKKIIDANSAIGQFFGDRGYINSKINAFPEINEDSKEVFINFHVDPGSRSYVRRISFVGNNKTADYVLRRELRQMEGGLVSLQNIKDSERRLRLLGYLNKVSATTKPVPGISDQVDIDYEVEEASSAQFTASVGYSTADGVLFGLGFNQKNFLGTGNILGFNFTNSRLQKLFSINYVDPYYTPDGISKGYSFKFRKTTPGDVNLASYTTDAFGLSVFYGVPITENDRLSFGYGYERLNLKLGGDTSKELTQFTQEYGTVFDQLTVSGGWTHNGYDRAIFPTEGVNHSIDADLGLPVGEHALDYYRINLNSHAYYPLGKGFIFSALGTVGYGNGYGRTPELVFFKNYTAGGPILMRGFGTNSLGPHDSQDRALGGNFLIAGSLGLILPEPISSDMLRATAFVDAGNVYSTYNNNVNLGDLRYSAGLAVEWRSPLGLLVFSLAKPLKKRDGDDIELFQFTVGTGF